MWQCEKTFVKNVSENANHSRWCELNPNRKRSIRKTLSCIRCGNQFTLLDPKDRKTTCSDECAHSHTDESKKLLSILRKKYLKENPDKHVWKRSTKFKSTPCENVKQYLNKNNIEFIEEYSPLEDRFYSIDIAFPNKKLGIEINGNQHYNSDGTLSEYYRERHNKICALGWNLVEAHYSLCFNEENIEKIINFKFDSTSNEEIIRIKSLLNAKIAKKKRTRNEAQFDRYKEKREHWEEIKDKIFENNIDFSKFGWVNKVAKVLDIKEQKVNKWMKKFQPEFYEVSCFKRKIKEF
jgi:hypothetical protein